MKHQVFISYSSKNLKVAQAACHIIEENGYRCWMAPRDITPGYSYADLIDDAIQTCDVFVLIFSQSSSISKWVRSELNLAFERQAHIIPFRVDDTPLEGANRLILNQTHWIDAYPKYEYKLNELVQSIARVLDGGQNISTIKDDKEKRKISQKTVFALSAAVILVLAILWFIIYPRETVYSYENGMLVVNSTSLTSTQASVLSEMLDNMIYVEGGSYIMGNTSKGDSLRIEQDKFSENTHKVTLKGFYISKYELTQEQWLAFTGDYSMLHNLSPKNPADYLSWEASFMIAERLKELTGLPFSLPTEAQWEYAAKGGNSSKGYIFSGADNIDQVAWVASFDTLVHKVGLLEPNEIGLHDMTGNVSEWCLDYYEEYTQTDVENPSGPQDGKMKVLRGGNIDTDIFASKITVRQKAFPNYSRRYTGTRLVINIEK